MKRNLMTNTNIIKIINDISEKNFTLSEIRTNDNYSLEYDLFKRIDSELDKSLQSIQRIYLVDANSVKTLYKEKVSFFDEKENREITKLEYRPKNIELPQAFKQIIGTPFFPIAFLKEKEQQKKDSILIIKDFDLLFKNRKEQLKAYHAYESEIHNFIDNNNKIIFISKEQPKALYESELSFVTYNFSNELLRKELIQTISKIFPEKFESNFEIDKLVKLTNNETLLSLKNLLMEDYNNSNELLEIMEKKNIEEIMERNPEIRIKKPKLKLEEVIGLENAKEFISKGMEKKKIKSVLLLGVPGTGKTALCEALAQGFNLPLIEISLTNTASKFVGESEKNINRVLNALKTIKEAVIYFDEIEKQIAGSGTSNSGDSGTGTKVLGELLKFLQERNEGRNIVLFTANNIEAIKKNCPELLRAGRIDSIFYVDFPTFNEVEKLCELYSKKYEITEEPILTTLVSEQFTGSEIETLYRLASMLDKSLLEAKEYIKPVSRTYDDSHKEEFMRA